MDDEVKAGVTDDQRHIPNRILTLDKAAAPAYLLQRGSSEPGFWTLNEERSESKGEDPSNLKNNLKCRLTCYLQNSPSE